MAKDDVTRAPQCAGCGRAYKGEGYFCSPECDSFELVTRAVGVVCQALRNAFTGAHAGAAPTAQR